MIISGEGNSTLVMLGDCTFFSGDGRVEGRVGTGDRVIISPWVDGGVERGGEGQGVRVG